MQQYKLDTQKLNDNLPEEIKTLRRFILWRYEDVNGRNSKIPYMATGRKARTNDPRTWAYYEETIRKFMENPDYFSGIGIVLGDGLVGIDLDHVVEVEGKLTSEAEQIIAALPGYVERSPSMTGIHILIKGSLPPPNEREGLKFGNIEFYDATSPRYLTLTGDVLYGRNSYNEDDASEAIISVYWNTQKAFIEKKEQLRAEKEKTKKQAKDEKKTTKEAARRVSQFNYDDNDALLSRIRNSRQSAKFTQLFDVGDWTGFKSKSEGVASLLSILAWWCNRDKTRIERLFRQSALFDPEKMERPQGGARLIDAEIHNACSFVNGGYDPSAKTPPPIVNYIKFDDLDDYGRPKATLDNLSAVMAHHGIEIFYDEIKKTFPLVFSDGRSFSLDNEAEAGLGELLSLIEKEGMPVRHMEQYLCALADANRRNPVKEWITSRQWDKVDRIQPLCDTIQTNLDFPCDLKETFIKKWLLSALVAACHDPFIKKFSTRGVLVLQGEQSIGKTKWLLRLAPSEWVHDIGSFDPSVKDHLMLALNYWICELGELESTLGRDMGRLKAYLTKQEDVFRLPFARRLSKYARRTVFAASVNKPQFLIDKTGNDRFWIIPIEEIDYQHQIDTQQVFAQLHEDWQNGAEWWLTVDETKHMRKLNSLFLERDEIHDLLATKINWNNYEQDIELGRVTKMTATQILVDRCGLNASSISKRQANLCSDYLREITGLEAKTERVGQSTARLWLVPQE